MASGESYPPRWTSEALDAVPHGFFGSRGGVSTGAVEGLNCGFGAGDDPAAVSENRRRITQAVMPGAALVAPFQVHSPTAVVVESPWPDEERPEADALVTDVPGILLAIVTADCAPVLLVDEEAGVIGAAHAGWRGAHGGVIESSVAAMERLGAQPGRIAAAIGPAIAQASYEVDDSFRTDFTEADDRFFCEGRSGHWQFDLAGYVASRLKHCGIKRIDTIAVDTYAETGRCFSYRRATHRGEPTYGRQMSVIGLSRPGSRSRDSRQTP